MGRSTVGGCPDNASIRSRMTPTDVDYIAWASITDHYSTHDANRVQIPFRSVEEIRRTIMELKKLLPVVDQLGIIADGEA